jgi:hypothetical protein
MGETSELLTTSSRTRWSAGSAKNSNSPREASCLFAQRRSPQRILGVLNIVHADILVTTAAIPSCARLFFLLGNQEG